MARPTKSGLDYFPLDTSLSRSLKLLKAKYGLEGIGFIDLLWRAVYAEGHFLLLDEEGLTLLADEFKISKEKFTEMLEFCISIKLFDKEYYQNNKVLTSDSIQKIYFHKTTRRTTQGKEFLLDISDNNATSSGVSVNRNSQSEEDTVDINYTNKRKEKEKKKKRNELIIAV